MGKETLLFCFTYAGGTTIFYDRIETAIYDKFENIKLIKLEYSGHGKRMKEPLYENFEELAIDLMSKIDEALKQNPDANYGMFGYSMGSLSAFVVLQKIVKEGKLRQPNHLFLAANPPKAIEGLKEVPETEVEEWSKQRTIAFGGIPKKLVQNETFWRMYLPIYVSDYRIIASYDFDAISFNSDIPTTLFYSESDTPFAQILSWNKYFRNIEFIEYDGTHFFINEHLNEIADVICWRLEDKL